MRFTLTTLAIRKTRLMKARSAEELGKAIEEEAEDQYFCPLPFEHLYNDNAGLWGPR